MSEAAKQAEKRQKTDAVQKEAKSSKKSRSDAKDDIQPVGDVTKQNPEDSLNDSVEASKKVAEGKEQGEKTKKKDLETTDDGEPVAGQQQYSLPEGYDPFTDPVIPSSAVAQNVANELTALGESPTLKALHAGRDGKGYEEKSYKGFAGSNQKV
jgi:hypothetical protein